MKSEERKNKKTKKKIIRRAELSLPTFFLFYFFFLRSKNRANNCSVLYFRDSHSFSKKTIVLQLSNLTTPYFARELRQIANEAKAKCDFVWSHIRKKQA